MSVKSEETLNIFPFDNWCYMKGTWDFWIKGGKFCSSSCRLFFIMECEAEETVSFHIWYWCSHTSVTCRL